MTKSTKAPPRTTTFATLRFSGDRLDPDRITAILGVQPTTAYRKGERYLAGPRAGYVTGRTGVWVLASDGAIDSVALDRHLEYLVAAIFAGHDREERLKQLHELMSREEVEADVSCFWRGPPGARPPSVPAKVISRLNRLSAEIETDFEVDEA